MTNNDILRRLRYAFNYSNVQIANIMQHAGTEPSAAQLSSWLKREDDPELVKFLDPELCQFLDGLVIEKRGPRPDGSKPVVQEFISTNEILKKLRVALSLGEDGMMEVFKNADFVVTKAELGSFFRKESHAKYAKCPEQVLRKFIHGLGQQS
ncbi:DUF1456 family protein [Rubritalea marina]|uniref:DUF1456 family protein n=1 Tax=Rubritalea marina TaxID=361055 RepID=UPI0003612356|nr:DUF1456 family protein [Rubritalea marina]